MPGAAVGGWYASNIPSTCPDDSCAGSATMPAWSRWHASRLQSRLRPATAMSCFRGWGAAGALELHRSHTWLIQAVSALAQAVNKPPLHKFLPRRTSACTEGLHRKTGSAHVPVRSGAAAMHGDLPAELVCRLPLPSPRQQPPAAAAAATAHPPGHPPWPCCACRQSAQHTVSLHQGRPARCGQCACLESTGEELLTQTLLVCDTGCLSRDAAPPDVHLMPVRY